MKLLIAFMYLLSLHQLWGGDQILGLGMMMFCCAMMICDTITEKKGVDINMRDCSVKIED